MPPQSRSDNSYKTPDNDRTDDLRRTYKQQRMRSSGEPSISGDSGSGSGATPSSVYLSGSPLMRELSDLSGSYMNGSGSRSGKGLSVPGHIYDQASFKGPWRHAYAVSKQPPEVSEAPTKTKTASDAMIFLDINDVVEVVEVVEGQMNGKLQVHAHRRIPIVIVLLDPARKAYEFMQVWVDKSTDYVRDVVQTMQHSIPEKWRQHYDGLFQMRGNKFSQLIHILRLEKYDVQPFEIWIAKPWSMAAKITIGYATSLIRHLTKIGAVCPSDNDGQRVFRPKSVESALLLSEKAQASIYAPEGILNHHHAVQFLTFSPPFDPNRRAVDMNERDESNSVSSAAGSNSGPTDSEALQQEKGKILADTPVDSASNRTPSSAISPGLTISRSEPRGNKVVPVDHPSSNPSRSAILPAIEDEVPESPPERRHCLAKIVSKLNCAKNMGQGNKERRMVEQIQQTSSLVTLTEEQERQWITFDIREPIAEDQSVATQSVVSMSAPLLGSCKVPSRVHDPRAEI